MENNQYSRIVHFQQNPASVKRFRLAISILYQLGVDNLLIQIGSANEPNIGVDPLVGHALQNARAVGFRECVQTLFSLAEAPVPEGAVIAPDYGALDKLLADGKITQEDYDDLSNGEIE